MNIGPPPLIIDLPIRYYLTITNCIKLIVFVVEFGLLNKYDKTEHHYIPTNSSMHIDMHVQSEHRDFFMGSGDVLYFDNNRTAQSTTQIYFVLIYIFKRGNQINKVVP